jgi:hypothetical protein
MKKLLLLPLFLLTFLARADERVYPQIIASSDSNLGHYMFALRTSGDHIQFTTHSIFFQ